MNKMLVWFHSFPEEPEVVIEGQLFEQILVSAFQTASKQQRAKKLFSGNFIEFIDYIKANQHFDDVQIILPAKEVLYTKVSVPSKSRNKIMQALPYLLEDSLLKPVPLQFVALGTIKEGHCQVAIVKHYIIGKIYEKFKELSIPVSYMTSEAMQLPWYDNKWTMSFLKNDVYIRTAEQSATVISIDNLEFLFDILLRQSTVDEQDVVEKQNIAQIVDASSQTKPDSIIVYAQKESLLIDKIKSIAQEYDIEVDVVKGNLLKLALIGQNDIKTTDEPKGINLLQGDYYPGHIKKVTFPFKRTLITVFSLWLVTQIGFMFYQLQLKKTELAALEQSLEQLYFKTFPESKRLIDVRSQTESKLRQLQNNASADDSFLSIVALVGNELRQFSTVKIKSLRFNDGVLQLDITSKGFIFNQIKSKVETKTSLKVEEKSSSRVKDEVHSTLVFRLDVQS